MLQASDIIRKGKMCSLFINDLDAGAGRMGAGTQYTVNNQMVNATLMNIADNPTNVQLPGVYKNVSPSLPLHRSQERIARCSVCLFSTPGNVCSSCLAKTCAWCGCKADGNGFADHKLSSPGKVLGARDCCALSWEHCACRRRSPVCPSCAQETTSPPCTRP